MYIIFKNEQNSVYSKYTIFTILYNYVHLIYTVSFGQGKKKHNFYKINNLYIQSTQVLSMYIILYIQHSM